MLKNLSYKKLPFMSLTYNSNLSDATKDFIESSFKILFSLKQTILYFFYIINLASFFIPKNSVI